MSDVERRFHESWLGMAQPIDGLVVSVPTLVDAQCMRRATREEHLLLQSLAPEGAGGARYMPDLQQLLTELLDYTTDDLVSGDDIPDALSLWVPEGRQQIRPTLAVRALQRIDGTNESDTEPAANTTAEVARGFALLCMELPEGLDLDRPETVTGPWDYPPAAKFERLLRHARVPFGVLTNGNHLRLIAAPHGEASGALTFRLDDVAEVGGRDLLGGMLSLLSSQVLFAPEGQNLRHIIVDSRRRQADVTNELADQVFEAIELLMLGFDAAAERDGTPAWREALARDDDHAYAGLLTTLLRLVFLLYAEDRGLMPVDDPLYAEHYSVLSLWERLRDDAAAYPDTMHQRFGAWPRLLALFRGVHDGMRSGDVHTPPRHGSLFDPERFGFLEGRCEGQAPPRLTEERATLATPSLDDGTVFGVLQRLLVLDGQRLSYQALDVEQIGSVYEKLMGYHVVRLTADAVCVRPSGVWVQHDAMDGMKATERGRWLKDETGLSTSAAKTVASKWAAANTTDERLEALESQRYTRRRRVPAGRLVLQPGHERRRTSSHYTPRSLSSRIVKRALEPVLAAMGDERSSSALLALKICDPAMGSGAFLVETCRVVADEVVAAWTREGRLADIARDEGDPVLHARRLVAQRCLYGVDKNAFAVELARLSLWLITLAADQPFTFVDHALRHGDSLVGLDLAQIRSLSWTVSAQQVLVQRELDDAIDTAVRLRREILALAESRDPVDIGRKAWLLRDADDALDNARLIADVVVGAFFAGAKKKERRDALAARTSLETAWLAGDAAARAQLEQWQQDIRAEVPVFCWMLEFPEVFSGERPDPLAGGAVGEAAWFDVFIGNPPFGGKNAIADAGGPHYIQWLQAVHRGAHGNADLSAHFFLRAAHYLGEHGTFGLIATNTIAQGDTRDTGLKRLVAKGGSIYDAVDSTPWPGEAGVTISVVHLALGSCRTETGALRLNGQPSESINSRLRPKPERPDPVPLRANAGKSFQGSIVLGMGFTLTPEERETLVAREPRNAERIFPYLGGAEVNRSPTQSHDRYVISFGQMPLDKAGAWPDLLDRVRQLVKPDRDRLRDNADGRHRKKYWWQFGRFTPALYAAIAKLDRCLVTARVSKHCMFSFQPTNRILNEKLFVFPFDSLSRFALLQSRIHVAWTWLLSSTLKSDLNYSATDCFETFPFPPADKLGDDSAVGRIGAELYEARARYLVDEDIGLTEAYNRLKDRGQRSGDLDALRELHEAMDQEVLDAYGWGDVEVPPYGTPTTDAEAAAVQAFEDEVIDRLFALNAERAKQERLGVGATKNQATKGAGGAQGTLGLTE